MSEQAILQAIRSLEGEVRSGFGRINGRLGEAENDLAAQGKDLVRIKTLWSVAVVLASFVFSKLGDAVLAWVMR